MDNTESLDARPEAAPKTTTPSEVDISPPRGKPFPIVGVGASAGGLEAFGQLFSALPANIGMAFVLVQHLDPSHESLLPELIAPHTQMPVVSVHDGLVIEPNHVYVIPPNTSMELQDGTLRLVARQPGVHLPIDIFFRSLARGQGSRAIGVVLSGNASDGSMGVRAIKAECGITFAQDEATARFGGMPRNAASTGAVDFVLAPAAIARELIAIANHPFLIPSQPGDPESETLPDGQNELRRIFALLRAATKVNFAQYKPNTIRRRIGRRMMVLHQETTRDYAHYLETHPLELGELYRDLLISVTGFFRDPETYDALRKLLESTLGTRNIEEPIRIWVPGCATGEEVYSLAILLFDMLQEKQRSVPVQVFGTDISELALERARHGLYSGAAIEEIKPPRLRRFFHKMDNGYQINKAIRECCVFARHDVTFDPPFSNLDLVSCRNLLIYLDQRAQKHVLPLFHFALKPAGLLVLGSAETTAAASDLFITVDQQNKIYLRSATAPRLPLVLGMDSPRFEPGQFKSSPAESNGLELQRSFDKAIQKYSPDAVLINSEFQVVQFRGHAGAYFDPAPGQANLNVLQMATEDLLVPLRRAIRIATETNATAREDGVELESVGQLQNVSLSLEVTPIAGAEPGERYYLIVFVKKKPEISPTTETATETPGEPGDPAASLERELRDTRSYLRNLTEEYEAHSEELRAANEEARSANEELQSTNEELRTTKEELQSTNEELTTVNEELQSRNQELNSTNSDLKNLLSSITIPILMLDADLRVRRFNSAAGTLLALGPVDIGRPVGHLRGGIEIPRLEYQVRTVIDTLSPYSEELQDLEGRWFVLNIRPYRTLDDRIMGAVITLQDIDPLKRGLESAQEARDYAEGMIETVREPLVVLDSDLRIQRATQAFYDLFLVSREETQGRFLYDLGNGQWNKPRFRELIGNAIFRSEPFADFEVEHDFPFIGRRVVRLNGRRIPFPQPEKRALLLSIEDVTERREIAEIRYQRLFETAKDGIIVVDVETQTIQDVNPQFLEMTGYAREEFIGVRIEDAARKLELTNIGKEVRSALESEAIRYDDLELKRRTGESIRVDVLGNQYIVGSRMVIQFNIRDVSVRNKALQDLQQSELRLRLFVESVGDFALLQMDTKGIIAAWNPGAERLLGWKETEAIGQPSAIVFTPEDVATHEDKKELEAARVYGRAEDERWHIRKDGTRFFGSGVMTRVSDDQRGLVGFAKVLRDVTSRQEQEAQLRRSVAEKETLVREIHHRVKNNLQVIVSLLGMQSRYTSDAHVLTAFQEAETRLRAIAHIHERLYASEDMTDIEFAEYVTNLAKELVQSHSTDPEQIELQLELSEVALHIERAIPLGLIANELIMNSIKHGLGGRKGRILVKLSVFTGCTCEDSSIGIAGDCAEFLIADSGPGLPPGLDPAKVKSMGLRLVSMLVRQLHGKIETRSLPDPAVSIMFPLSLQPLLPLRSEDEQKSSDC